MYSPKLDDFLKLASQGNLIPVTRRILADFDTPLSAYKKIRGQGESFLFESVEGGEHLGRYSFVGCNPRAVIKQTANRIEVIADRGVLVKNAAVYGAKFLLAPPRPDHWGGYRLVPDRWEFWQGRKSRLHDRLRYRRDDIDTAVSPSWVRERLAP